jgi:hypothetical protein
VQEFYNGLGHPTIERNSVWEIYNGLLEAFQQWSNEPEIAALALAERSERSSIPLLPNLRDLPFGVNNPVDESGSIYLGGRPEAFQDLRTGSHSQQADFDDELSGYRIEEVPYLEIDMSDDEPRLDYLSE